MRFEVEIHAHKTDILTTVVEAESANDAEEKVNAAIFKLDPMLDIRCSTALEIDGQCVPMEFQEVDLDGDTWDLQVRLLQEASLDTGRDNKPPRS
jgi:hypothetical protein